MNSWQKRCLHYFSNNPFSGFVFVIIFLILTSTFLLILKQDGAAEKVANLAYVCLFIAVIIKLAKLIREKKS